MEKLCGHCGRTFSCTQTYGCWCGTVKLEESQRAWITQQFENCLCPECLAAVAAGTLSSKETAR